MGLGDAAGLSKDLGVTAPGESALPSALYELVTLHQPMESCCPELLHQNHLVSSPNNCRQRNVGQSPLLLSSVPSTETSNCYMNIGVEFAFSWALRVTQRSAVGCAPA